MCAWCCLCQAAPGQQVFKERQSNLPLSTCDIGSFSCCISRVVINWLFQHSEHAMMLQAMPNPFCTKVTAIWKLVSTFLSTFQVPTCVKKKNEEFRTVFHYWQTQFLKLSGFSCRSPEVFYKSMGWRRSGFGGNTAGKIKTGKHEITSNTGGCVWPWDIRADMNYWNYGSVNLCVVSPCMNSEQVLYDCKCCWVGKPSGHGMGGTCAGAPACSFSCLNWIICCSQWGILLFKSLCSFIF